MHLAWLVTNIGGAFHQVLTEEKRGEGQDQGAEIEIEIETEIGEGRGRDQETGEEVDQDHVTGRRRGERRIVVAETPTQEDIARSLIMEMTPGNLTKIRSRPS